MRQLVAIRVLNLNHPNKPKMQRYQSRRGLLTFTKWIISQLIICLPACSKLTVTFMPTIDWTWPGPQSGWFGCATKSPRLKYNICTSHAWSCRPYVPQRRKQGNAQVRIKHQPITNIARLAVNFLKIFFGVVTPAVRRWQSPHYNRIFCQGFSIGCKWCQSEHCWRQHW